MNKPTAKDLGLPTFEMRVGCGTYCQGGTVEVEATTYPELTDASEVWVRGSDVAALAARVAELEKDAARYRWLRERAIGVEMYPDMQGLVFAIPLPAEMSLNIVPAFVDSCIDAALSGADGGSQK